jgi:asparagine synthase (glutamine-hydrolysing)
MCGIAGLVYRDANHPVDRALLGKLERAIRHRGPDDVGLWVGPGVGLAHRRLSIIDLSPAGHQPMANEDETVWISFNGEIYNFRELREGLVARGHRFRSRTDSEVIVHLYEELGPRCIERLDGMFALAVWDVRERRLVLARDRLGKKPLKYAELPEGGIVFASELKALLASGLVSREIDDADVHRYLAFGYVPAPGTGFRAIRKLPPAHTLVWDARGVRIERYWSLDYSKKREQLREAWCEEIRGAVKLAVKRRLMSDVPLGAFLSGGIDSTIVVAAMAEQSSRPVETFSIGFAHAEFDELPYARRTAERYGTSHHEFQVRADDATLLPELARLYEEPYADSSALPSWFLAREARAHVTVALNGDGGDEAFSGYDRYRRFASLRARMAPLRPLRGALAGAARVPGLPPRWARYLEVAGGVASPRAGDGYFWVVRLLSPRERSALYRPHAVRADDDAALLTRWMEDPRAGSDLLDAMCLTDAMTYLPDDLLVKMDLATMAHGLEGRSPLLDHHVLELAASIPSATRAPAGRLKGLLKDAFAAELPDGHAERPKSGFAIPIQDWLRGPWAALTRESLLARDARVLRWFEPTALARIADDHFAGRNLMGHQLFTLLMLELWLREVVESPETGPVVRSRSPSPSPIRVG